MISSFKIQPSLEPTFSEFLLSVPLFLQERTVYQNLSDTEPCPQWIGTIPDIPDLGPNLESIPFSVRVTEFSYMHGRKDR